MTDPIQLVKDARPDAHGPTDEVAERAREALQAQLKRGRPSSRWGRRRVIGLAAPALAAAAAAIILGITLTEKNDEPARAAAVVQVAQSAPRLLVDDAKWRVAYVGRFSVDYGEITLAASGRRRLKVYWLPLKELEPALEEAAAKLDALGAARAAKARARLFRIPGTDEYVAVWRQEEYMVQAQGRAPDKEAFKQMLSSLRQVGAERWLSAMPERLRVRPALPKRPIGAIAAVDEMSVFKRPAEEKDTLPKRLHYRLESTPCPALGPPMWGCLGEQLSEESRLLLSGLGQLQTTLRAWPTTEGWVCFAWDEGGGGCTPDFTYTKTRSEVIGIDPGGERKGAPLVLVGIVPDDVVGAEVAVDGVRYPAVIGNNGFFYELPNNTCIAAAIDSITLMFADGSAHTRPITFGDPLPPGEPPPPKCSAQR